MGSGVTKARGKQFVGNACVVFSRVQLATQALT